MTYPLTVENPKRNPQDSVGRASWYPYYAGFSSKFAHSLLSSARLSQHSRILDPWNGGGTTTAAAAFLGLSARGYDLNPVMAIVAKARLLSHETKSSLSPIAADLLSRTLRDQIFDVDEHELQTDPLGTWFRPIDVRPIRRVERSIVRLLVNRSGRRDFRNARNIAALSDLASFYYLALFRAVRFFLRPFFTSNPTWIKKPRSDDDKIRLNLDQFLERFAQEIGLMLGSADQDPEDRLFPSPHAQIGVASSQDLPDQDNSVDFVLSSPPYCTRIDYAVATMPELAIMGYAYETDFRHLRRSLIGSATVPASAFAVLPEWGQTCTEFLQAVQAHDSKASRTYYYKNHLQYFDSIHKSLRNIQRVLVPQGRCVLVVQDSYYKDVHNDLPQVFVEMGDSLGLRLTERFDFRSDRSMARINRGRRQYKTGKTLESVLCFTKDEKRD